MFRITQTRQHFIIFWTETAISNSILNKSIYTNANGICFKTDKTIYHSQRIINKSIATVHKFQEQFLKVLETLTTFR